MKKFLATLLVGAVSAVGIFGFTACGGNDGGEAVTKVNAEEWQSAFTMIYDREHSVEAVSTFSDGWLTGTSYHYWFDNADKITHLKINWSDTEGDSTDVYCWKGTDGKYYSYDESKKEIDKDEFDEIGEMYAISHTGNGIVAFIAEKDIFSTAIYDETTKDYKCTFNHEETIGNGEVLVETYICTLKFENRKLVKLVADLIVEEEKDFTITVEYNYDNVAVTIPQDILNMEVSE